MVVHRLNMVDVDPYNLPHRKPVLLGNNNYGIQSMTKIIPDSQSSSTGQRQGHYHSRTVSSSIFPIPSTGYPSQSSYQQVLNPTNRRTPSNATNSSTNTSSTTDGGIPRTHSSVSISLRRSTSSRSGASISPCSYVALMRKQKATVWCDRAQHEDPRMVAQLKAAKLRATMEVVGGNMQGRTSTSGSLGSGSLGVRSKIRHHGAPKAIGYSAGSLAGGGVPMRLSASEVGDDVVDEDDTDSQRGLYKPRSGSGRNSLASSQRLAAYNHRSSGRLSQDNTPPSGQESNPGTPSELAETPIPGEQQRRETDYFQQPSGNGGSGSSSERESSFGNVGDMKAPIVVSSTTKDDVGGRKSDDLNRRGSVDERAPTMRGAVRLFVANPDLSD